jgi:hypothetical protein
MREKYYILILIFACLSCSCTDTEKEWIEIRKSNSIEKYQDYLIENPQTKYLKEITDSLRLFWIKNASKNLSHYNHGNNINIDLNNGLISFDGFLIEKSKLSDTLKYSIQNPYNLPGLPEKDIIKIDGVGEFEFSLAIIDIRSEQDVNPKLYSEIINIVIKDFSDFRDFYSLNIYGKKFKDLNIGQKETIQKIVPLNIRFEKTRPVPPKPSAHIDSIFTVRGEDKDEFESEIINK